MTPTTEPVPAPTRPGFPPFRVPSSPAVIAIVAVVVVLAVLLSIADALPVFILGLIFAYILDPLVTAMAARRVPRGVATIVVMALAGGILILLASVFLETILTQAAAFVAGLPAAFAQLEDWVRTLGLAPSVEEDILAFLQSIEASLKSLDVTSLFAPIVEGLAAVLGSFFTLLTLPFFLFFVLAGRPALSRQVREVLPDPWRADVLTMLGITTTSFGTYIRAELTVASILGVMTFVGVMLLSVLVDPAFADFALLLAIISALSEFIPNYGPWIAAIPAVLIALTISPAAVVATIILYLILMFTEGQVLVPKIEGGAFSFHPALVLFLVVAGVALFGILGAILALPVTAALWRSTRFAFRRAGGLSLEDALAWSGDAAQASVLEPAAPARASGPAATPDAAAVATPAAGTGASDTVAAERGAGA